MASVKAAATELTESAKSRVDMGFYYRDMHEDEDVLRDKDNI